MSETKTPNSPESLHLLVFKGDLPSRAFRFPFHWITGMGLTLIGIVSILTASLILTYRYYQVASTADPDRIGELEKQLAEVQSSYDALRLSVNQAEDKQGKPIWFNALSNETRLVPTPARVPIEFENLQAQWNGQNLLIRFNMKYSAGDGGSQRGRIIAIARGKDAIYSYPKGLFNLSSERVLVNANQGESFSFSRFREVNATFNDIPADRLPTEAQILALDRSGAVLLSEVVDIPPPGASQ